MRDAETLGKGTFRYMAARIFEALTPPTVCGERDEQEQQICAGAGAGARMYVHREATTRINNMGCVIMQ